MTFMKHIECSISNNRFFSINTLFRITVNYVLYDTGVEYALKITLPGNFSTA